jgi:hypothetical protein
VTRNPPAGARTDFQRDQELLVTSQVSQPRSKGNLRALMPL